jgi:ABC-type multidrug transport system fused ATPase/permease subunit
MQRPTWATVVGIIGIVMAIYTLLNSGAGLMMPEMISMQSRGEKMQQDAMQQAATQQQKFREQEKEQDAAFKANVQKQSGDFQVSPEQKKFAEGNEKEMETFSRQADAEQKAAAQQGAKMLDQYRIPKWYGPIAILMSLIAMVIAAFYLFTSILLLQTKPSAISLFSLAAVASIGFAILHGVVSIAAMGMMGMALTGIFVSVVNVVLLIVVATGDKEAFRAQSSSTGSSQAGSS